MDDCISRKAAIDCLNNVSFDCSMDQEVVEEELLKLPSVQPERKTGYWILDRSGAYCCSKCMEPCAGYVMMKPRDKFCKTCGSRNEVTE